jgi:ubiquinone/menaquinone biosynthesis C-methylase UbiE
MTTGTEHVVDCISRSCVLDRVLVAGEHASEIADRLRLLGAEVRECGEASIEDIAVRLSTQADTYSLAVLCLTAPVRNADCARYLFTELRRTSHSVYLEFPVSREPSRRLEDDTERMWWERQAIAHGFRRHPMAIQLVPYESLDGSTTTLLLESVSGEEDIHPEDDLRSVGLDVDATVSRYERATHFIRRHDRVLDLDCGGGAGAATVAPLSFARSVTGIVQSKGAEAYASAHFSVNRPDLTFCVTNPAELAEFADETFDVVLSCRGLPARFWTPDALAAIYRVLTPGGRMICCSPADDHQVRDRIREHFLLERVLGQRVRRDERGEPLRSWHEVGTEEPLEAPWVDWWMFVAMKDPRSGSGATYEERRYPHTVFPGGPNPTRYVRSFDNPWLHASVFNPGNRLTNSALLRAVCEELSASSPSLDGAAAACVLGYALLEDGCCDDMAILAWLDDVDERFPTLTGTAASNVRWRVSLLFVAGRLAMRISARARALRYLRACMMQDATQFSSLLATKTIEAAYWVGILHARLGHLREASSAWSIGIGIARGCVNAEAASALDLRAPLELFGFREFSQVFDAAGRCAAGLAALGDGPQWGRRLTRLLRHGSLSAAFAEQLHDVRRAVADERLRSRQALAEIQSQHEQELARIKAANNAALLRHIVLACRGSNREVVVWGAGIAGRRLAAVVHDLGGTVSALVDSDLSKQATSVSGLPVISPAALQERSTAFVLVGSMFAVEIEARLIGMGRSPDGDFVSFDPSTVGTPTGGSDGRPQSPLDLKKSA